MIVNSWDAPEIAESIRQCMLESHKQYGRQNEVWDLINREIILNVDKHQYIIPFPDSLITITDKPLQVAIKAITGNDAVKRLVMKLVDNKIIENND